MTSDHVRKFFTLFFVLGFFTYLFGPLIVMGLTAFNSAPFPSVSPWECFTVEWFDVLVQDDKLVEGLRNSLLIGIGVVLLSVPLGLAGALMLTQVRERVRPWYYTIVISPILVPGVVLAQYMVACIALSLLKTLSTAEILAFSTSASRCETSVRVRSRVAGTGSRYGGWNKWKAQPVVK